MEYYSLTDEDGNKINKHLWDDYSMNPMELLDSIWNTVPEWRYPVHIQP